MSKKKRKKSSTRDRSITSALQRTVLYDIVVFGLIHFEHTWYQMLKVVYILQIPGTCLVVNK